MRTSIVLAISFLACCHAGAANPKVFNTKLNKYTYSYPSPAASSLAQEPNADAAKLVIEQEGKRKLASTISEEWFEAKMSPEFKQIRDAILQIKTGEQLDQKLSELDQNYATLKENDSKFFAAQIIPLRAMRGMVWRLKPLVSDVKMAHSILLTVVKNVFIGANLFFPTNQTEALTQYLTQPFIENGIAPWSHKGELAQTFSSPTAGGEGELQAHFQAVVIPMLETAADRVAQIRFNGNDWRVFDNRMWYGGNTFPDAVDRYALVGEVERYTALTNLYSAISTLSYQTAYSWNNFMDINVAMAQLYGWDSVGMDVEGAPLKKRVKVLSTRKFYPWGTLQNPQLMSKAWTNLRNSVIAADNAWQGMKTRPVSEYTLVDNSMALPFQRPINARFQGMKNLLNGEYSVVSAVTRETVKVNLKAFFENPPKDLREMYPTGFVEGKQMTNLTLQTASGPRSVSFRNYLLGSGEHWNLSEGSPYKRLFPEVKNDADLKKHLRVLSQGWGTSLVASPLVDYFY